ncbi:MAG: formate dehydrogenase accessory sulfurtransferase FdhD [Gemmatimonadota bacterium]|nr:MAG: formate dehydrogenase accessory sulfurtransferase FdhD [Gemmatimonadota bacterium]
MTEGVEILRISEDKENRMEDVVARETPLTVVLNGQELVTLLCTPSYQKNLAVGFLLSEGFLQEKEDVQSVVFSEDRGTVSVQTSRDIEFPREIFQKRTITSGCGKGAVFYNAADRLQCRPVTSKVRVMPSTIRNLMREVNGKSELFKATGGVHTCALCLGDEIVMFREDIGRHNAIDKILGECFLEEIRTDDKIMVTSGRLTSEMLIKVAKQAVPMLVSRSGPTDLAIHLAKKLKVTLIGFVRGARLTVYSGDERVVQKAESVPLF